MYTSIRWQQRFQNFEKAYKLLDSITKVKTPSEGERMGLIQAFEICFELSWKVLSDYQKEKGYIVKGPKDTLKQAFQDEIIQNGHAWMEALESRNETVHIYDQSQAMRIEEKIRKVYHKIFQDLYFYLKNEYKD